ncbi:MAG TPA: nuclear transport factor 2 family protein [Longimicrobium sp.]|nr:nuclear transport factor 2 family protein [Longimicrobium sp.]
MRKIVYGTLILAAACADAQAGDPTAIVAAQHPAAASWRAADLNAERAALTAASLAHGQATAADIGSGYASYLTESSAFLAPRVNVQYGPAAAEAYLETSPLFASMTWTEVARADVSADGTTGYTIAFGSVVRRDNGATLPLRLLSYWEKVGGEWKVAASVPVVLLSPAATPRPVPAGFGTPTDNGVQGAPSSAGPGELEAVMQADRDFSAMSVAQNPAIAFRSFAAPTAMTLGGPAYGPDEIGAEFASPVPVTLQWAPIAGGVAASGDLGYTIGLATAQSPAGTGYTKYLTVWQRQPNGTWLYVSDGGSSRPAS